ncbi:hypothetical protein NDU88_005847 [Pleurodeles waltl]|uniref:Uncharacterized protein n=1 Tax=Pleurodeles waltl TaxID=8319 RepID=A0AAV7NXQ3_PLEWA|nr:hypothetical protein NDU88_005847 [Pleurodeles waltl]
MSEYLALMNMLLAIGSREQETSRETRHGSLLGRVSCSLPPRTRLRTRLPKPWESGSVNELFVGGLGVR